MLLPAWDGFKLGWLFKVLSWKKMWWSKILDLWRKPNFSSLVRRDLWSPKVSPGVVTAERDSCSEAHSPHIAASTTYRCGEVHFLAGISYAASFDNNCARRKAAFWNKNSRPLVRSKSNSGKLMCADDPVVRNLEPSRKSKRLLRLFQVQEIGSSRSPWQLFYLHLLLLILFFYCHGTDITTLFLQQVATVPLPE